MARAREAHSGLTGPGAIVNALSALRFQCPACRAAETSLGAVQAHGWTCSSCGESWTCQEGVVRALGPDARRRQARFSDEYLFAHRGEGPDGADPADHLELPFRRATGPGEEQWYIRAGTYRCFERKVLAPIEQAANRPLSVLELGAGVGWLSYRLALRGHAPVALDLLDDPVRGLGAARHYPQAFPRIQAELDNVPLADEQFDLAVFSASFHYAADYRAALREVRRLLGWGGQVVILDTPIYESYVYGEQVREERLARFERERGAPAESLLSMEYLDEKMIRELGKDLNIRWRRVRPWRGLRWSLRPALARLHRRTPPPQLEVLVGSWVGG